MSERVIAKRTLPPAGHGWESQYCQLREDLEAPSVAEVVQALEACVDTLYDHNIGRQQIHRAQAIIARLEGA